MSDLQFAMLVIGVVVIFAIHRGHKTNFPTPFGNGGTSPPDSPEPSPKGTKNRKPKPRGK